MRAPVFYWGHPHEPRHPVVHIFSINQIGLNIMKTETQARLMRIKQLTTYISLSRGYIYEKINEGTFPPGVMISSGVRAWDKKIVDFWISKKMGRGE